MNGVTEFQKKNFKNTDKPDALQSKQLNQIFAGITQGKAYKCYLTWVQHTLVKLASEKDDGATKVYTPTEYGDVILEEIADSVVIQSGQFKQIISDTSLQTLHQHLLSLLLNNLGYFDEETKKYGVGYIVERFKSYSDEDIKAMGVPTICIAADYVLEHQDIYSETLIEQAQQIKKYNCTRAESNEKIGTILSNPHDYEDKTVQGAALYVVEFSDQFTPESIIQAAIQVFKADFDAPQSIKLKAAHTLVSIYVAYTESGKTPKESGILTEQISDIINYAIDQACYLSSNDLHHALLIYIFMVKDWGEMSFSKVLQQIMESWTESPNSDSDLYLLRAASLSVIQYAEKFSPDIIEKATNHFMSNYHAYPDIACQQFALAFLKQHEDFFFMPINNQGDFILLYWEYGKDVELSEYSDKLRQVLEANTRVFKYRVTDQKTRDVETCRLSLTDLWELGHFKEVLTLDSNVCLYLLKNRDHDAIQFWIKKMA